MFNLFKLDEKGAWKTEGGEGYTVVSVNDESKHPRKEGWCRSLENAIKAGSRKAKEPANESTATV